MSKSYLTQCLQAELVCRVNTSVVRSKPLPLLSVVTQWCRHCQIPRAVKSLEVHNRSSCHVYFTVPLHSTHPYPSISHKMFASKASLLKSLLFLLSLTSISALSIQQKVRQEGIVVPGTNIDKCYCSYKPHDLHTHGRIYYTQSTKAWIPK